MTNDVNFDEAIPSDLNCSSTTYAIDADCDRLVVDVYGEPSMWGFKGEDGVEAKLVGREDGLAPIAFAENRKALLKAKMNRN